MSYPIPVNLIMVTLINLCKFKNITRSKNFAYVICELTIGQLIILLVIVSLHHGQRDVN